MTQTLLKYGANPQFVDGIKQNVIFYLARDGKLDLIKELVEKYGLDPNSQDLFGQTPIFYASLKNRIEVI